MRSPHKLLPLEIKKNYKRESYMMISGIERIFIFEGEEKFNKIKEWIC
jgi:hypothetical protein